MGRNSVFVSPDNTGCNRIKAAIHIMGCSCYFILALRFTHSGNYIILSGVYTTDPHT